MVDQPDRDRFEVEDQKINKIKEIYDVLSGPSLARVPWTSKKNMQLN